MTGFVVSLLVAFVIMLTLLAWLPRQRPDGTCYELRGNGRLLLIERSVPCP